MKGNYSKEWLEQRKREEENLRSDTNLLYDVPEHLDEMAKLYYQFLIKELESSCILCNLDIPTLEQTSDCLSKIRQADDILNEEGIMLKQENRYGEVKIIEHPMVKTKHTYLTRYVTLANALGLDPSSRAVLASRKLEAQGETDDELLKILRD